MLSMQKLAVLTVGGLGCTILRASPSHSLSLSLTSLSLSLLLLCRCHCFCFRCRCWACRSLRFSQLGDWAAQFCLHLLPTHCHCHWLRWLRCLRCRCLSCRVVVIVFVFVVNVEHAEPCGSHSWGIGLHLLPTPIAARISTVLNNFTEAEDSLCSLIITVREATRSRAMKMSAAHSVFHC